jgi:hypothetical protein
MVYKGERKIEDDKIKVDSIISSEQKYSPDKPPRIKMI